LRKDGGISEWISFPADAFCPQRPCFRATSFLFSKKIKKIMKVGKSVSRVELFEKYKVKKVLAFCPHCMTMFEDGLKNEKADQMRVLYLA